MYNRERTKEGASRVQSPWALLEVCQPASKADGLALSLFQGGRCKTRGPVKSVFHPQAGKQGSCPLCPTTSWLQQAQESWTWAPPLSGAPWSGLTWTWGPWSSPFFDSGSSLASPHTWQCMSGAVPGGSWVNTQRQLEQGGSDPLIPLNECACAHACVWSQRHPHAWLFTHVMQAWGGEFQSVLHATHLSIMLPGWSTSVSSAISRRTTSMVSSICAASTRASGVKIYQAEGVPVFRPWPVS